jgi:glycosyltransferase involved in cell wall biosynthesis
VVLAKQFKEKFIDLGVDFKKIIVSSPMVESEKYIREDKSFSSPYKVLFCANMIKEKGPFEILEAAPTVLTKFPEIKFTFIGNGKDLEILKVRSKEIVIENNVEFTGYVSLEEKIRIFKKSNIFVFPSIYGEGFPVVIIEAMAAGLPVITTPNAGLADAIENDKQGLILNTKPSSIEVANKIIKLLENPNLMKKMSENNIREAKEKYDVKIVTEKMVQIYNHILIDNPVFI